MLLLLAFRFKLQSFLIPTECNSCGCEMATDASTNAVVRVSSLAQRLCSLAHGKRTARLD